LALTSGTCLGPYEIVAQIGAGGMGEGYIAAIHGPEETDGVKAADGQAGR